MRHRQCMFGPLDVWSVDYRAGIAAAAQPVNKGRDMMIFTAHIPCLQTIITLLVMHGIVSTMHCWHAKSF